MPTSVALTDNFIYEFYQSINITYNRMGDDQKKGNNLDYTDVENGPLTESNRQCRDVFCCLLYLFCIVAMIYLTAFAYANGNPSNIYRPISSSGMACGDANGLASAYPYVYYSNPLEMTTRKYCVQSCPALDSAGNMPATYPVYPSGTTISFSITVNSNGTASGSFTTGIDIGYDSSVAISRICLPSSTVFSAAFKDYTSAFSSIQFGDLANFIVDIRNNWQLLIAAFGLAIVIAFIWMFCLRCLAGVIVWCSIFGIIIFFALIGIVFLYNNGKISALGQYKGYLSIPSISAGGQQYYDIYGYICFALSGIFFIAMLCCCSRIRLAVAVCKAAGQFIVDVCLIMLVPIFQASVLLGFWAACLAVMIFLVSAANFQVKSSTDYFTSVSGYDDPSLVRFYIFVFATLWSHGMIQAIGTFVIASACCMWYYSHGPGAQLDLPIFRSYKMAFRFHFGSLAFGSLLLAIVQALQIMVQLFKKQAESSGAGSSKCVQYCINCLRCCLACVERIVQFINKTAYIQIAIRGKNFCTAAKDGFELVWSNGIRYTIVAGIGEIMMFLGKLAIAALTTGLFYLLILYNPSTRSNVLQPIYLLIVVFIMSYAVGMLFMSVYSLAMDTLLACFIVDETNQKAKGGKAPQYAPPELAALMDTD